MLIDLRFEQLKPRTVPAFETEFALALPQRAALSPLGGFWRTEVGNVDQLVQVWPYQGGTQRDRVLKEAAQLPAWAAIESHASSMEQESRLLVPAPFSPPIEPRKLGGLYELRIYSYEAGRIPYVIERWQARIEARLKLSPLVMCGFTTSGRLHQWVHLWAYENALERQKIRAESIRQKIWPPDATAGLIRQQNMLLVPSSFSPLN
jgi:hypothetical protein